MIGFLTSPTFGGGGGRGYGGSGALGGAVGGRGGGGMNDFSTFQLPNSYGLEVKVFGSLKPTKVD